MKMILVCGACISMFQTSEQKKMYYYRVARNTDLIYQTGNPIISILQDFSLRVFD